MNMSGLIGKMIIFVVLMVIGYACARTKFAGREFTKDASKMVINVFMSATIINSVLGTDITLTGRELGNVMLVLTLSIVVSYVVAAIAARVIPLPGERRPLFELLVAVVNNMFIALPVLSSIFGNIAVFYCSLSCIPYNLILYTYGTYRLKSGGTVAGSGGISLKDVLSMPLIATLIALVIFLLKPPAPALLKELLGTMSNVTMPLSMIVIGSSLGSVNLLDTFKDWRLYIMSTLRLLVCPLLVWLLAGLITTDPTLLTCAVIIAASPSAVIVTVLTIQYDRDAVYTSKGILLSTVFSMVTIPAIVYFIA